MVYSNSILYVSYFGSSKGKVKRKPMEANERHTFLQVWKVSS